MEQLNARTAEQLAAQAGVTLTERERAKIAKLQNAERERLHETQQQHERWSMDWFNAGYAGAMDLLLHAANLLQAFGRTMIVGFGTVAVLVLLAVVEQQRLHAGLLLFEERAHVAAFAAWAVVLLNLTLEFVIEFDDSRHDWEHGRSAVWSLRIALKNTAYRLGIGSDWTEREQPPSFWARRLLKMVTLAILVLSLAGSMADEIELQAGKPWAQGFKAILENSDALLFASWLGGLLFAAVAVFGAQGLARYTAHRTAEIIAELRAEHGDDDVDDAVVDGVAVNYIMAKLARKADRDGVAVEELVPNPTPIVAGTNGNGHK
jgi:hypothetical protein